MLDNLKTNDAIKHDGDSLGGGFILKTDAYKMACDSAYFEKSKSGALSFNVALTNPDGQKVRQQWWVTSGDAKGNKNFYVGQDKKEHYLPGFSAANNFCLLACGMEISALSVEKKMLKLYSYEEKKEVPQEKDVAMDLIGKEVIVAVEEQLVDKTAKTGEMDTNNRPIYAPTGETRKQNEIVKSFRATDRLSAAEIRAEEKEAVFIEDWTKKNKGTVNDMSTGVVTTDSAAGAPGSDVVETKNLF